MEDISEHSKYDRAARRALVILAEVCKGCQDFDMEWLISPTVTGERAEMTILLRAVTSLDRAQLAKDWVPVLNDMLNGTFDKS